MEALGIRTLLALLMVGACATATESTTTTEATTTTQLAIPTTEATTTTEPAHNNGSHPNTGGPLRDPEWGLGAPSR